MTNTTRTTEVILKDIKSIATRGAKWSKDVQALCVEIAEHVVAKREASLACKLFEAMPKGVKSKSLEAWFITYAACKVGDSKIPLLFDKEATADIEEGKNTAWFDCKPAAKEVTEFDVLKKLAALLKGASTASESGATVLHAELIDQLAALLPAEAV